MTLKCLEVHDLKALVCNILIFYLIYSILKSNMINTDMVFDDLGTLISFFVHLTAREFHKY